jgi:hypothetical protein
MLVGKLSSKSMSFGSQRNIPIATFIILRTKLHGKHATFPKRFRTTAMNNAAMIPAFIVQSGCEKNFSDSV